MDSEAIQGPPEPPSDIPRVLSVQTRPVRFDPPVRFYRGGRLVEMTDAIELLVQTAAAMPVLDETPVLFIGSVPVSEYVGVGPNLYRFRAYDVDRLQRGARISIGWPNAPASRIPTPFVFDPGPLSVA
jgi:hypothetical protein